MLRTKFFILAALAASALFWVASPATAQRGGYGGGARGFGGFGGGYHGGYRGFAGSRGGFYHGGWGYPGINRNYIHNYPRYGYGGLGLSGYFPLYGGYAPFFGYGAYGYGGLPYGGYTYSGYSPNSASQAPYPDALASGVVAPAPANTRESLYYAPPADNKARVRVHLPANATLWIADEPTSQTGEERDFTSPALTPGMSYSYELKARWMEGGRVVERTRKVQVRANQTTTVDFGQEK